MARGQKKATRSVERIVPALTARTQLGQILQRVKQNKERFFVDRRGEPQAVIMSFEDYLKNFTKPNPALEKVRKAAKAKGLDRMTLREINREIKKYRQGRRAKNA
jgi:prevent-host-death family protein